MEYDESTDLRVADVEAFLERPGEYLDSRPGATGLTFDDHEVYWLDSGEVITGWPLDAQRLAAMPELERLVSLRFLYCHLGAEGIAALASSPHLRGLRRLDVFGDKNLGDEGAIALASSPSLRNLDWLCLQFTGIGPRGARALVVSSICDQLTFLGLVMNPIGDEGVTALACSPHLARLTRLTLAGTGMSDAGAVALAESPFLRELTKLDIFKESFGARGQAALRDRFGGLSDKFQLGPID